MRSLKIAAGIAGLGLLLSAGACDETDTAAGRDDTIRQSSYEQLQSNQPAESMSYSPTRATKNFWIKTWNQPGKLSYVYLQNSDGALIGYYVLKGLPVSYCVSLVPPTVPTWNSSGSGLLVQQPSVDGTYSSGQDCSTKYGEDATTGAYIEFTVGNGQNVLLYDQPLPRQDVQPLGQTTIAQAQALPQPPAGDGTK